MCGIAGILSKTAQLDTGLIHKMAQSLQHRGPDGYKIYQEDHFLNSHNLLRIFSTRTKPGPYTSINNRWVLSFNGEIYNHEQLKNDIDRIQLTQWQHHTDSEILLEGWSLEGESFLSKINGMFSFSIWDKLNKVLYLGTDTLAEKNLYYTEWNQNFIFASEVKSLASIHLPLSINYHKIDEYLSYRFVSGNQTLFKNIYKLLPGEILKIDLDLTHQSKRYQYQQINNLNTDLINSDTLSRLINLSVSRQTSKTIKNSIFLSSGLDSSYIASQMPENSYALTLSADPSTDTTTVHNFCKSYHLEHINVPTPDNISQILDECIWAIEEPIGDSIIISNLILAKAAKILNTRIVLSGDGADELFGGYIHHFVYSSLLQIHQKLGSHFFKHAANILQKSPDWFLGSIAPYSQNLGPDAKRRFIAILKKLIAKQNFISEMTQIFQNPNLNSEIYQSELKIQSLKDLLKHDQNHWLPYYILQKNDKLLMSQSIEGRHPYLDREVVHFANQVPDQLLIKKFERKSILKNASINRIPKRIAFQKKKSFVINYDINQLLQNTDFQDSILKDKFLPLVKNRNNLSFIEKKKLLTLIVFQRWMNIYRLG